MLYNSPKTESAKWKQDIDAMIFQTKTGVYWSNICRGEKGCGEASPKTTDNSSMPCFGYCEQGLLGEICRLILEAGAIRIGDLFDGEMPESGRSC